MNDVVTRFAPSPTGYLHIGSIRTALINYIYTQQRKLNHPNSKFLLRIEDTDKTRSNKIFKESILNGLEWLMLKWDGDLVIQSKRIKRHKEIAYKLLKRNLAFKCICTIEELEKKRLENKKNHTNLKRLCSTCENDIEIQKHNQNYCIRIKIPIEGTTSIFDKVQGNVKVQNKELDNFILLRKNGTPTYMLSVVVDDHDMGVNNIIRGDDHLNNTFRQIHIYNHLKWVIPQYSHIPLLHGVDGKKLSKRHGAVDINEFKKIGYLPHSIVNSLILLGWSPKKNNEIIEIDEIIKVFKIDELSKSSSIFDYNKLNYFNNYYLKKEENYFYFEEFIKNEKEIQFLYRENKEKIKKIFEAYKQNINHFSELLDIIRIYFDKYFEVKEDNNLKNNIKLTIKEFIILLDNIDIWNQSNLEN